MIYPIIFSVLVHFISGAQSHAQDLNVELNGVDQIVLGLEQDRLLNAAGLVKLPGGLAAHFFSKALPYMAQNNMNFRQLEEGLRKWNTGMHLLAVPEKFMAKRHDGKGQSLCINPIGKAGGREFWIFLSGSGPQRAEKHRQEFEITSVEQNLKNLENTGVLGLCPSI